MIRLTVQRVIAAGLLLLAPLPVEAGPNEDLVQSITKLNKDLAFRRWKEAEFAGQQLLALSDRAFADDPAVQVICLGLVAGVYVLQGKYVASNWIVDDESTAALVQAIAAHLAEANKKSETPDHAQALHAAKYAVRRQTKWQDPFYWASLVLVGPH